MNEGSSADPRIDPKLFDLFCVEVENQARILTEGLLQIEGKESQNIESLLRAIHSIKGAARILGLDIIVKLAHAMEDNFVLVHNNKITLTPDLVDIFLQAIDVISALIKVKISDLPKWLEDQRQHIEELIQIIENSKSGQSQGLENPQPLIHDLLSLKPLIDKNKAPGEIVQSIRVSPENLNALMGLAGEILVESRWLYPFEQSLVRLKNYYHDLTEKVTDLRYQLEEIKLSDRIENLLSEILRMVDNNRLNVSKDIDDLDLFIYRHSSLSDRIYQEVIKARMRPFSDCIEGFPRLIRDLARLLNKKVRLEIIGKSTPVDRDILDKLETPLIHLLRNAVDHGIETPEERRELGKPEEGLIILEAKHVGGTLSIAVTDDGNGLDFEALRKIAISMHLVSEEKGRKLSEKEIIDLLCLPGFSTSMKVTETSGRGIGLNIVLNMVKEVGGRIQITSSKDKGMHIQLQMPLTISVIRTLAVEISGEPYAFPLGRIRRVLNISPKDIQLLEGQQYIKVDGENIGLVSAHQILELDPNPIISPEICVVAISDGQNSYGCVVDRFIGEKELVVQELDPRLGKVPDIAAGAFMEDGTPLLILDVTDMIYSIDQLLAKGVSSAVKVNSKNQEGASKKRILVVDDSLTVREVQSRLLENQGYIVDTAVNGIDGWNAVRISSYDLVITDLEMPKMNGFELIKLIKNDIRLKHIPVLVVTYREGSEDRRNALMAGADKYLTKSMFQDAVLLQDVSELLGEVAHEP